MQPRLDRVAVDAAVLHLELVGELVDLVNGIARDEPERHRLLASRVLLARVDLGEPLVGRDHRPCVLERLALPLLPEHLEDVAHAASASTTRSTHATSSRESRRKASRSSDAGPWPVTTARSFSQSGSV